MGDETAARAAFIRRHLPVLPVPGCPGLRYHAAQPSSGLARLAGGDGPPPYWAYLWPGGHLLMQHIAAEPGGVLGRRILDLGAGSGLVGIAAARGGAAQVRCAEVDPVAQTAIGLNAALNGVVVELLGGVLHKPPQPVDTVMVGDLFYEAALAKTVTAYLERCLGAGQKVLVGDIGRAPLPLHRLQPVASYPTRDVGDSPAASGRVGCVYRLRAATRPRPPPPEITKS